MEAGGPMAGRGCAGLGIGTAIRELDRLRVFLRDWDLVVYDVLGDVVCGGFSLPMKKNRIDRVYVVTSAEANVSICRERGSSGCGKLLLA